MSGNTHTNNNKQTNNDAARGSFADSRRLNLLEGAPQLPFRPDDPKYFLWLMSSLVDISVNLIAISRTLPEHEPNPYNDAQKFLARAMRIMYDTHQVRRWAVAHQQTAIADKIELFFAANRPATKQSANVKLHKTSSRLNSQDREIRNTIWLLNPMLLRQLDYSAVGDYGAIVRYGLNALGSMGVTRGRNGVETNLTYFDPMHRLTNTNAHHSAARRLGAGFMEPIYQRRRYWQTWTCWQKKHNLSPFYKYHAAVWGRRQYAKHLRSLGFEVCPVYQIPINDFDSSPIVLASTASIGLTDQSIETEATIDIAHLELAELDFMGRLRAIGAVPELYGSVPVSISLPIYILNEVPPRKLTADNFERVDELPICVKNIHQHPGLYRQEHVYGTSQAMFGVMLFIEKVKAGFIPQKEYTAIRDQLLPTITKDAREHMRMLNEMSSTVRLNALDERRNILASLPRKS